MYTHSFTHVYTHPHTVISYNVIIVLAQKYKF
jgi:hypothetical protein